MFLLVVSMSAVNAVTIEDLLATYDYDYSVEELSVIDYTTTGEDTNANSLFDNLIISVNLNSDAKTYDLIGELSYNDIVVQSISLNQELILGQNTINFPFKAKSLENYTYNFSLKIFENATLVLREDKNHLVTFDINELEPREIKITGITSEAINNESDSRLDYLAAHINLDSTINEEVTIFGYLTGDNDTSAFTQQTSQSQDFTLLFDSEVIRDNNLRGKINLSSVTIETSEVTYNYELNSFLGEFQKQEFDPKKTILTNNYQEDIQNISDKINNLTISIEIETNESGEYQFKSALHDSYGNFIEDIDKSYNLNLGTNAIDFVIDGETIYNSKLSGPYVLSYVKILKNETVLDSVTDDYTTNTYLYNQFVAPSLPELNINNISLDDYTSDFTGIDIEIKNMGIEAYSVSVEVFDDNFELLDSIVIPLINSSYSLRFEDVKINDTDSIFVIIDNNNEIEETNETNNVFSRNKDIYAPELLITSPIGELLPIDIVNITALTDENANCSYTFENEKVFFTSNGLNHLTQFNVQDGVTYNLPITCKDEFNNSDTLTHTFSIQSYSLPEANILTSSTNGKPNLEVEFIAQTTGGKLPLTYSWDFDNDGIEDASSQIINHTFTLGLHEVTLTVTDAKDIEVTSKVNISVFNDLIIETSADKQTLYPLPSEVQFTSNIIEGNAPYTYSWDVDNDGVEDYTIENPSHTFTEAGNFNSTLTVCDQSLCKNSIVEIIAQANTVPSPVIFANVTSGIEPLHIHFDEISNTGNGEITYEWYFDDDDTIDFTEKSFDTILYEGFYEIIVIATDSEGDVDASLIEITVTKNETLDQINCDLSTTQNQQTVNFNLECVGRGPFTYDWSFGNTSKDPTQEFSVGTHDISVTVTPTEGNAITLQKSITIDDILSLAIETDKNSGDSPLTVNFNSIIAGGSPPYVYIWDMNDDGHIESNENSITHTFNETGEYMTILTACDSSTCLTENITITVNEEDLSPTLSISSDKDQGRIPLEVNFKSKVTGGNFPLTYSWDIDNDGVEDFNNANITHIYTEKNNYVAKLTVCDKDNDCVNDTINITAIDESELLAQINLTYSNIFHPSDVKFESIVTGGNGPYTYEWDLNGDEFVDFEDSSFELSYGFSIDTMIALKVCDSSQVCVTDTERLFVQDEADIDFEIVADKITGDAPLEVSFSANVITANTPVFYEWDMTNDGDLEFTQDLVTYTYSESGIYNARLRLCDADNDCDEKTIELIVTGNKIPTLELLSDNTLGKAPFTINIDSEGTGDGNLAYSWDINGDDVEDYNTENISHTYTEEGFFRPKLTMCDADNECISKSLDVFVNTNLVPSLSISSNIVSGEAPLEVAFDSTASGGDGILTYSWDINNDSDTDFQQDDITFTYTKAGSYIPSLRVCDEDNDCVSKSVNIVVESNLIPTLNIDTNVNSGEAPLEVNFDATTSSGDGTLTYSWDIDNDGNSDFQEEDVTHTYTEDGDYIAKLTVCDEDNDCVTKNVSIIVNTNLIPSLSINADKTSGIAPLEVTFTSDITSGDSPYTYSWDIDNDGVEDYSEASIIHTYSEGNYVAKLTVCDKDNDCVNENIDIQALDSSGVITKNLKAGWNLFGANQPTQIQISEKCNKVWSYNGTWQKNPLTINSGLGFWILAKEGCSIDLHMQSSVKHSDLSDGWNLVTLDSILDDNKFVVNACQNSVKKIWLYNGTWSKPSLIQKVNADPYQGAWVLCGANQVSNSKSRVMPEKPTI